MTPENTPKLVDFIKRHEKFVCQLYKCPTGHLTIGYGHNCEAHGDVEKFKDRLITEEEAYNLLLTDINESTLDCVKFIQSFPSYSDIYQFVLLDMCFNMGIAKLLKFGKMLDFFENGPKKSIAREMINSHWCEQVGRRATELVFIILTGEFF
jgi:lysozyme